LQSDAKEAALPPVVVVPGGQAWHAVLDPFTTVPKVPCSSGIENRGIPLIADPWSTSHKNVAQFTIQWWLTLASVLVVEPITTVCKVGSNQTTKHDVTAKAVEQYPASRLVLPTAPTYICRTEISAETHKAAQGVNLLLDRLCTV
jgi:hypothetical protein